MGKAMFEQRSNRISGAFNGSAKRFAIISARFNDFITKALVEGARDALVHHQVAEDDIVEIWVPGALELALAAKKVAKSGRFDAIIVCGAVIRGATAHFEIVINQSAAGLSQVAYEYEIPVGNAVLTTESIEQAIERAGTKAGNKGFDAAMVVLSMLDVLGEIEKYGS